MRDLSLHLLDIIENSAKAGASLIALGFSWDGTILWIRIQDNGPGFPQGMAGDPSNPFYTTRTTRKVGLGLPLFREAAEQTGGSFHAGNGPVGGVRVEASFDMAHLDAKPLGDLRETLLTAIRCWPKLDVAIHLANMPEPVFDTRPVRAELGDVSLAEPEIMAFLSENLEESLNPLNTWVAGLVPKIQA